MKTALGFAWLLVVALLFAGLMIATDDRRETQAVSVVVLPLPPAEQPVSEPDVRPCIPAVGRPLFWRTRYAVAPRLYSRKYPHAIPFNPAGDCPNIGRMSQ